MIELDRHIMKVPKGTPDAGVLELDLSEVRHLESRKVEVAAVTKMKAPELMAAMEQGYGLLAQKLIPMVGYELAMAKQAVDQRKAVVELDEAPRILKEKGLSTSRNPGGSEGQRENVLALDEEYQTLVQKVAMIHATLEMLKGKMRGFEMSFTTVKKTYDSMVQYGALANASPSDFSDGIPDEAGPGDVIENGVIVGKPKY